MDWINLANKEREEFHDILTTQDYFEKLKASPKSHIRTSAKYLKDMIDSFGQDSNGRFLLFSKQFEDSPSIYGQDNVQKSFYQQLVNFNEEGFNNKFTLLVGPNGSCKTSIIKKLMKGAEIYSDSSQGAIYTFSWIFPIDNFIKGSLGLAGKETQTDLQSFAHLEDKDISAILNSELKDHPILLIPKKYRQELLRELFQDENEFNAIKRTFFYTSDLSKRNRLIYDALLNNYKGNHEQVLKHIRVERFKISRRYSISAVTIEPQLHVDARLQQITMDKRLASLPSSLQSLNLFSMQGEAVMANRGILEFSDLLKRPLDSFKYLLMTIETKNLNIQGVLTELDILFTGTSNEIHLQAFRQHPDFKSFKGRFSFIKVPYLLDYKEESKIYFDQIKTLNEQSTFEPHAIQVLCLFSIMTRYRHCETKNYTDKKLANIATNLSPIEKALLISDKIIPEKVDSEGQQVLLQSINEIKDEHKDDPDYEGKFGISPRDIKNIIYKLSSNHKFISFQEVLDYLKQFILKREEYDFLKIAPHGDYHNPKRFIEYLEKYALDIFDKELREGLGLIDERSYEKHIKKYIEQITALMRNEKVKNKVTGIYENNSYFIKEFETSIQLKENPEKYRSHLLSKMGAWALDHVGDKIIYTNVFPEITNKLKESFRIEQEKVIQIIAQNLVFFEDKKSKDNLSKDITKVIEDVLKNLQTKFKYSRKGALNLIKLIIKDRY